jgi:hypothetical protein
MDLTPAPPRKSTFLNRLRSNLASPALEETEKNEKSLSVSQPLFFFLSSLLAFLTRGQNDARTCTKKRREQWEQKKNKSQLGNPYLIFLRFLRVLTKWLQLRRALQMQLFFLFLFVQLNYEEINPGFVGRGWIRCNVGPTPSFLFSIFAKSRIEEIWLLFFPQFPVTF